MSSATPTSDRYVEWLRELIRQEVAASLRFSGIYEYSVVASTPNKVDALPVDSTKGLPAVQGIPIRAGLPGTTTTLQSGGHVAIGFLDQNPTKPYVFGIFDSTGALQLTVQATSIVLGGQAATPIVPAPWAAALDTALTTFATAMAALTSPPLTPIGTAGGILEAALAALPPDATTVVEAQ